MSQDELHSMATADTPDGVTLPKTWPALIVWALGRFGVGLLVAAAFAYAAHMIYQDNREDREKWIQAHQKVGEVLEEVKDSIEANTKAIDDAHWRASSRSGN